MTEYTSKKVAADGDVIMSTTVHVRKSLWKALKRRAVDVDMGLGEILEEAIKRYLNEGESEGEKATTEGHVNKGGAPTRRVAR